MAKGKNQNKTKEGKKGPRDRSEEFEDKLKGLNAIGDLLANFNFPDCSESTISNSGWLIWRLTNELLDMNEQADEGKITI